MSLVKFYTECGITEVGEIFYGRGRSISPYHCDKTINPFIIFAYYGDMRNTEYTVSDFVQCHWGWQNSVTGFCRCIYHIHPINPNKNSFCPERVSRTRWE